jgi:hypothetical protein
MFIRSIGPYPLVLVAEAELRLDRSPLSYYRILLKRRSTVVSPEPPIIKGCLFSSSIDVVA